MAKDELCVAVKEGCTDVSITNENAKRHNSVARSAKEATVDDILSIMQKLDLGTCPLTFLVDDVSRVPTCSPESGTLMNITREMSTLKREMSVLQKLWPVCKAKCFINRPLSPGMKAL